MTHQSDLIARDSLVEWLLRQGDSALVLGHRVSEWCGHAPVLEEDIAQANIALDLIGQARLWLSYAGDVEGKGRGENELAFLRDAFEFRNLLLVEQPNGDFGMTIMRQFFFDAFQVERLASLTGSTDERVAEIAEKTRKEASYHLERSAGLVVRLGDGTEESRGRMQAALNALWPLTHEFFAEDAVDGAAFSSGIAPLPKNVKADWDRMTASVLGEATLSIPETGHALSGGLTGRHSEHLGHMLAQMQFLQRAYPGAVW